MKLPTLSGSAWLVRPETQLVFRALNVDEHTTRAVGGAVRNTLLGGPVADIDFATTASPSETMRFAKLAGLGCIPTGLDHGTVTVVADHVPFEVTTLRRDVETDGRRAVVAFTNDWATDAQRRDFTINALYCDADGTLFDPLSGYDDIRARRVRFIGTAQARIAEDHLRILRFLRFTAEYAGGVPDADGLAACFAARAQLKTLSRERIRAELLRLMISTDVSTLMPSIASDFLAPLLPRSPDPALFSRVVAIEEALDETSDAIRRLGALTGARLGAADDLKEALRLSAKETERLARLSMPDPGLTLEAPDRLAQAFIYRHGPAAFRDGVLMAWARSGAPPDDTAWAHRARLNARWTAPMLPVRGSDITDLGIPAGPKIGRILAAFEDWWIAEGFPDDAQALTAKLREIATSPTS